MIEYEGCHFPKDVILYAVRLYVLFPISFRDLEEIMQERGVDVGHATLNRWVVSLAPLIADKAQ